MSYNFLIMGGDQRQLYLGKFLEEAGFNIFYMGFGEKDNYKNMHYDYFILPAPLSKDGLNINTPLSDKILPINDIFGLPCPDSIFSGKCSILDKKMPSNWNTEIYDLLRNDEYNILNAVATAEAAISIIVKNTTFNIYNSDILVAGYGKIGKVLAKILRGMGAKVTVAARKASDRAYAMCANHFAIHTKQIKDYADKYRIILNTVPEVIITEDTIRKLKKDCFILDLASMPGGVDFLSCDKHGLKYIHGLGLPGKYSPETSGEITAKIILDIIDGKS